MLVNHSSPRSVVLIWSPPEDEAHRDGDIIQYKVNCDTTGSIITSIDTKRNSTVLTELLPYHEYTCCVAIETTNGKSAHTCLEFTTLEEGTTCRLSMKQIYYLNLQFLVIHQK